MGLMRDFFGKRILIVDVAVHSLRIFVVRQVGKYIEIDFHVERKYKEALVRGEVLVTPGRIADEIRACVARFSIMYTYVSVADITHDTYTYSHHEASNRVEIRDKLRAVLNVPSYAWSMHYIVQGITYTTCTIQSKELTDSLYTVIKQAGANNIIFYPRSQLITEIARASVHPMIHIVYEHDVVRVSSAIHGVIFMEQVFPLGTQVLRERVADLFTRANPTHEDIETLLRTYGTSEVTRTEARTVHAVIHKIIQPIIHAVREQRNASVMMWRNEPVKICVHGTMIEYKGVIEDISVALGEKIQTVDPWIGIINTQEFVPILSKTDSLEYVATLGFLHHLVHGAYMEPFDLS